MKKKGIVRKSTLAKMMAPAPESDMGDRVGRVIRKTWAYIGVDVEGPSTDAIIKECVFDADRYATVAEDKEAIAIIRKVLDTNAFSSKAVNDLFELGFKRR